MFLYKNCIYYIWQRAIKRAADESGAFKNVSEDDLAQYVGDTAKLFADQVLAEAQMRNEPIDTVLKASDIVYEDGAIRLAPKKEDGAGGQFANKLADSETDAMANEDTRVANILNNLFQYYQVPYNTMTGLTNQTNQMYANAVQQANQANANSSSMWGNIANAAGTVAGAYLGGPVGGAAGSQLASNLSK